MVSSVDGLAGAAAVGSSGAAPQRREVASEVVTGAWGRAGPPPDMALAASTDSTSHEYALDFGGRLLPRLPA